MSRERMNSQANPAPTCDEIIAEARKWDGVRWRHQGRTRLQGIDCVGLIVLVAQALGISDWDITTYGRRSMDHGLKKHFYHHMEVIKNLSDAGPGDVVLMKELAFPTHVGILGHGTLIHAYLPRKKVVEEPYSADWVAKTTDAFKFEVKP